MTEHPVVGDGKAPVGDGNAWCSPFLAALPVDHAAVATLGDPFDIATVAASSDLAAALDESQLDLGEGPAWDAATTRSPTSAPDVLSTVAWPLFAGVLREHRIGSVYAFPLLAGRLVVGAISLYAQVSEALGVTRIEVAVALASPLAFEVLGDALLLRDGPASIAAVSRRVVHQATGMVVAQLHIPPRDALLVIRGHAFAEGRTVRQVSEDIVERRFSLRPPGEDRALGG